MLPPRLAACARVVAVGSRNGMERLFVPSFRGSTGVTATKCYLSASASGRSGRDPKMCANRRQAAAGWSLAGGRHIMTTAVG